MVGFLDASVLLVPLLLSAANTVTVLKLLAEAITVPDRTTAVPVALLNTVVVLAPVIGRLPPFGTLNTGVLTFLDFSKLLLALFKA